MFDLRDILDGLRARPYVVGTRRRTSNYPSSASVQYTDEGVVRTIGTCLRSQWYEFKGFKSDVVGPRSARISRILEAGNLFGDMFVRELKEAGLWVGDEIPFQIPEVNVSGRIDCLIKNPAKSPAPPARPSPDQLIGVEFKTTAGYYKIKGPIISTRDTPLAPKEEHVLQCCLYLKYYKQYGIDQWLLIYIDRALGQSEAQPTHWNVHSITFNDEGNPVVSNDHGTKIWSQFTVDDILYRYKKLNKYVDDDKIPPRDYCIQYPNSEILRRYTAGELNKTDTASVKRAIKGTNKSAADITDDDPVLLDKGDFYCRYCDFAELCYSDTPDKQEKKELVAPAPPPKPEEPEKLGDIA